MLACKTPSSLSKESVFYSYSATSYNDGTTSVEAHEWHVRSIQNRKTYLSICGTRVNGHKRAAIFINLISKKKGVTWVANQWTKYIAKDYQVVFEQVARLPEGIYTTQLQSIKYAVKAHNDNIEFVRKKISSNLSPKDQKEWTDDLVCYEKELKLLKTRLKKLIKLKTMS